MLWRFPSMKMPRLAGESEVFFPPLCLRKPGRDRLILNLERRGREEGDRLILIVSVEFEA
jgi:hypothetical protein